MARSTDSASDSSGIPHWPTSWLGNIVVDLDNLGDPGLWIEEQIPDPVDRLFGNPDEDDDLADQLTEAYISAASDLSFPLPSDFDAKPEETRKVVKDDFLGFIREWRRLALAKSKNEVSLNPDERTQQFHRKVVTWDLLKEFGFTPDPDVCSDVSPGLSFDFGNFKLSASCVMNMRFAEVVMFAGVLASPRTLAEVNFEMPREIDSSEQGAAWITWNLDQSTEHGEFRPTKEAKWLAMGREHQSLLPWVIDLAAYEARPHCYVERDWARVTLKTLRAALQNVDDDADILFCFDGEILKIRCGDKTMATAATGGGWSNFYALKAKQLRTLPKRLMHQEIEFSVRESHFYIANWRYDGVMTLERP